VAGNPAERRRTPRAPADFPLRLGTARAQLRDISEGGLACRTDTEMEEMTKVQIDLELPAGTFSVEGAIVYCSGRSDGMWDAGILFLDPKPDLVRAVRSFVTHQLSESAD